MTPPTKINERDPAIASYLKTWKRNRDMIAGEDVVKSSGELYLTRAATMSEPAHANLLSRTPFFAGASRTFDGLRALASRKPATVTAPDSLVDVLNTITSQGYTLDDLALQLLSELMVTNFAGLLVDYPTSPATLSKAQAIDAGVRPFVSFFTAESILGIESGAVNNRKRVTRVRLLDDLKTVRELRLDAGIYTVSIWQEGEAGWSKTQTFTPTKSGKTIDEIPFTVVSSEEQFTPSKASLSDVCSTNAQLFLASSNLALCHWWLAAPIPYVIKTRAEGEADPIVAPGSIWQFDCNPSEVQLGFLEWGGAQVSELRSEVESLKADMAKLGLKMLADDKASVEAAETHAIRRSSENALVANLIRVRDRKLNDALKWVSWWLDLSEDAIKFEASTDLNDAAPDPQALAFLQNLYTSGIVSKDTYLDLLVEAEILPAGFDRKADAQKIAEELADIPVAMSFDPEAE